MKNSILTLLLSLFALAAMAQHPHPGGNWCGTSVADQELILKRLKTNRAANYYSEQRGATTFVAVRFTRVGTNDGSQRASNEEDILEALCLLNEEYEDQDIVFYIKEIAYLDNTAIYEQPGSNLGYNLLAALTKYDALNIYLTKDASSDNNGGITLAFYRPPFGNDANDYIVCDQNFLLTDGVISHEVGHFFSLAHTFFGWEPNLNFWAEDANNNGIVNYLDNFSVGPVSLNTSVKNELQSGANCDQSDVADAICDTKPDYGFGFMSNNCTYNGNVRDFEDVAVTPLPNNFMSYFRNCNSYVFTDGQKQAMAADLASPARNYIRPNFTPNTTEITGIPTLTTPPNNSTTDAYNVVFFEWDPVPGASKYLVTIDRVSSFAVNPQYFTVNNNSTFIYGDFDPDKKYYWRVTPFNDGYTCTEKSGAFSFTTGTVLSTNNIQQLSGWQISPNPARSNSAINIAIDAKSAFTANVQIFNATGQLVLDRSNENVNAGSSNISLNTPSFTPGIYFVQLQTNEGVATQRMVITE